jgi:hypothetical protein
MSIVLALLLAAVATPVSYSFPAGVKRAYEMEVAFDGYIQFMGGRETKAEVTMEFDAAGLPADDKGDAQVKSELTALKVVFSGTQLPLDASNAKTYFPPTTVSITPQGKVVKTNAPEGSLPVRIPGLDVKRFPEISYLPVEFPEAGVEEGKPFTFKKTISGSEASYTVKPTKVTDSRVDLEMQIAQTTECLEDQYGNVVTAEGKPASKVTTTLTGSGNAVFDRSLGVITLFTGQTSAVSSVANIKSGKTTERRLKTTLRLKLKS